MEVTRQEESSIGTLKFFGEDFFLVYIRNIPRETNLIDLITGLVNDKNIKEPVKENMRNIILDKAPEIKAKELALFFFNPRPKSEGGSILSEIEAMYEGNGLKGDPLALAHLNILDKDNSFVKKYPHMSLFKKEEDSYCLGAYFSEVESIEGFNISVASNRRQSGYFPSQFWFCGVTEEII